MQTVVLDTNALLMPFEFSINLDHELLRILGNFRAVVPGPVIGELKRSGNKHARAAMALANKYERVRTEAVGDEAVLEAARDLGAYVLTNDKHLRDRLRRGGVKTIFLRSGNHLVLED